MTSFLIIFAFVLGFILGIIERKTDNLSIKLPERKVKPEGEILKTPSVEELEKEEAKVFYSSIK